MDLERLLQGLDEGKVGAASRLISVLEQGDEREVDRIMKVVYPRTGYSWIVGITGPPGAGKSSLVNQLIHQARSENKSVGVILVDPTSPISGGAVLGDRIRMSSFAADGQVFIRSMGSRGKLGGLAVATLGAVRILDCLKKDIIFVETVGSGQVDIDICDIADTVCLVLIPGAGDAIQAMKAGIREVNDIFVINKCDRPGVEQVAIQLQTMLEMSLQVERDFSWQIPICRTDSLCGDGVNTLWQKIVAHRSVARESEFHRHRKAQQLKKEIVAILLRKMEKFLRNRIESEIDPILDDILGKLKSPQRGGEEIFAQIVHSFTQP